MKVIILAAGMGKRLGKYTKNLPKGMLNLYGKSIIERQVDTYRRCGMEKIIIVTGYKAEKIDLPDIIYYHNNLFDQTNMVESLMCARNELEGDVIVSYADILFEDRILAEVIGFDGDIGVTVDLDWKPYWQARHGDIGIDTESLSIDMNGNIDNLGIANPSMEDIDGRYVGLLKFSAKGMEIFKDVYDRASGNNSGSGKPYRTSRSFENAQMTDMLQEIIDSGYSVKPINIKNGWLEFDTTDDYENVLQWSENGRLKDFYQMDMTENNVLVHREP